MFYRLNVKSGHEVPPLARRAVSPAGVESQPCARAVCVTGLEYDRAGRKWSVCRCGSRTHARGPAMSVAVRRRARENGRCVHEPMVSCRTATNRPRDRARCGTIIEAGEMGPRVTRLMLACNPPREAFRKTDVFEYYLETVGNRQSTSTVLTKKVPGIITGHWCGKRVEVNLDLEMTMGTSGFVARPNGDEISTDSLAGAFAEHVRLRRDSRGKPNTGAIASRRNGVIQVQCHRGMKLRQPGGSSWPVRRGGVAVRGGPTTSVVSSPEWSDWVLHFVGPMVGLLPRHCSYGITPPSLPECNARPYDDVQSSGSRRHITCLQGPRVAERLRLLASHQGEPGSNPGWVTPGCSSAIFPSLSAAPFSPHFTLHGSQYVVDKSHPNLSTHNVPAMYQKCLPLLFVRLIEAETSISHNVMERCLFDPMSDSIEAGIQIPSKRFFQHFVYSFGHLTCMRGTHKLWLCPNSPREYSLARSWHHRESSLLCQLLGKSARGRVNDDAHSVLARRAPSLAAICSVRHKLEDALRNFCIFRELFFSQPGEGLPANCRNNLLPITLGSQPPIASDSRPSISQPSVEFFVRQLKATRNSPSSVKLENLIRERRTNPAKWIGARSFPGRTQLQRQESRAWISLRLPPVPGCGSYNFHPNGTNPLELQSGLTSAKRAKKKPRQPPCYAQPCPPRILRPRPTSLGPSSPLDYYFNYIYCSRIETTAKETSYRFYHFMERLCKVNILIWILYASNKTSRGAGELYPANRRGLAVNSLSDRQRGPRAGIPQRTAARPHPDGPAHLCLAHRATYSAGFRWHPSYVRPRGASLEPLTPSLRSRGRRTDGRLTDETDGCESNFSTLSRSRSMSDRFTSVRRSATRPFSPESSNARLRQHTRKCQPQAIKYTVEKKMPCSKAPVTPKLNGFSFQQTFEDWTGSKIFLKSGGFDQSESCTTKIDVKKPYNNEQLLEKNGEGSFVRNRHRSFPKPDVVRNTGESRILYLWSPGYFFCVITKATSISRIHSEARHAQVNSGPVRDMRRIPRHLVQGQTGYNTRASANEQKAKARKYIGQANYCDKRWIPPAQQYENFPAHVSLQLSAHEFGALSFGGNFLDLLMLSLHEAEEYPGRMQGTGNVRSPRTPADQRIVQHDSHLRKSGSDPTGDIRAFNCAQFTTNSLLHNEHNDNFNVSRPQDGKVAGGRAKPIYRNYDIGDISIYVVNKFQRYFIEINIFLQSRDPMQVAKGEPPRRLALPRTTPNALAREGARRAHAYSSISSRAVICPDIPRLVLPRRARLDSRWGRLRISNVGIVIAGFLGISRFLHPHIRAAPHSPHFTLIGSQDLAVKNRRNLSTQFHHIKERIKLSSQQHNAMRCGSALQYSTNATRRDTVGTLSAPDWLFSLTSSAMSISRQVRLVASDMNYDRVVRCDVTSLPVASRYCKEGLRRHVHGDADQVNQEEYSRRNRRISENSYTSFENGWGRTYIGSLGEQRQKLSRNGAGSNSTETPLLGKGCEEIWSALNIEVLMNERGGEEIPEKICRAAASSATIPTCENPRVTRPEIEPASPWWEVQQANRLSTVAAKFDHNGTCGGNRMHDPQPRRPLSNPKLLTPVLNALPGLTICTLISHSSRTPITLDSSDRGRGATMPLVACLLGDIPFAPPLHPSAAPFPPRYTLIGSEDLVKSRPNISTQLNYTQLRPITIIIACQIVIAVSRQPASPGRAGRNGRRRGAPSELRRAVAHNSVLTYAPSRRCCVGIAHLPVTTTNTPCGPGRRRAEDAVSFSRHTLSENTYTNNIILTPTQHRHRHQTHDGNLTKLQQPSGPSVTGEDGGLWPPAGYWCHFNMSCSVLKQVCDFWCDTFVSCDVYRPHFKFLRKRVVVRLSCLTPPIILSLGHVKFETADTLSCDDLHRAGNVHSRRAVRYIERRRQRNRLNANVRVAVIPKSTNVLMTSQDICVSRRRRCAALRKGSSNEEKYCMTDDLNMVMLKPGYKSTDCLKAVPWMSFGRGWNMDASRQRLVNKGTSTCGRSLSQGVTKSPEQVPTNTPCSHPPRNETERIHDSIATNETSSQTRKFKTHSCTCPAGDGFSFRKERVTVEQLASGGKREIPEETWRPVAASSGTILTCENPGVSQAGIEHGSSWWDVSRLTAHKSDVQDGDRCCTHEACTARQLIESSSDQFTAESAWSVCLFARSKPYETPDVAQPLCYMYGCALCEQ
ncbi:hypothetical protein PR048_027560 [Dryococelus australis]|uniref:Uncharacterized protein n=1 Tax=Dryococelus australis TaxID=614101 RepID=A0ABQ9GGW1_9NEOP|nr:hypothetical protein PR048_027560 [Dryococelus australis]